MDFATSLGISASGLAVQRQRMNIIASNIANAHATRSASGEPYRRRQLIVASEPVSDSFQDALVQQTLRLATVKEVHQSQAPFREAYEPGHPDANERGFVKYPNVSMMEEMVSQMLATNAYEANITALNSSKNMVLRAMDIGR
jgi:flagellar basal-body rod protein FlgC